MDKENNQWLDALANKQNVSLNDPEYKMAQQMGNHLRKDYIESEPDSAELNKLLHRLENEGLLKKQNTFSHFWRYSIAAGLALVISVPVLMHQDPSTIDYPVMRGIIDSHIIKVLNPEESAKKLKQDLAEAGQQSQIFKRADNFVVTFKITKFTPAIQKVLTKNSISLNKTGMSNIEFTKK